MITIKELLKNLSVARTEFKAQNESVYSSFVTPPFFEQINILNYQHSIALVGGRGSGKTMYLKYFSHWSQLDPEASPTQDKLKNIILYWKPDTIFFRSLERGWISEKSSTQAFKSFVSIEVTKEIISFLLNARHHFESEVNNAVEKSDLLNLINKIYGLNINKLEEVNLELDLLMGEISSKAFNEEPFQIISPERVIQIIISRLSEYELFHNISIKIYIDEFENLSANQQSFINGLRKHSTSTLSWNVAYKAFATVSNYVYVNAPDSEQLQKQNDYREINIDKIINSSQKKYEFFSKILLVSINKEEFINYPVNECLRLATHIFKKTDLRTLISEYCNENKNFVPRILKQLKGLETELGEDLIEKLVSNPYLLIALVVIRKHNNFNLEILKGYLNESLSPDVKRSFEEKQTHYIQAAIYKLNISSSYNNIPIYSGFDKFMTLCSGNVRHFLELCYQSFQIQFSQANESSTIEITSMESIPAQIMHKGAILTSENLIKEVISFAPMGQKLDTLVSRLGELFRITHQLDVITQPENNHFGLTNGLVDDKTNKLLMQALCWNVLIEHPVTKERAQVDTVLNDYQLNPIYAPAFGISYRKMHKINFTITHFSTICFGENLMWEKFRQFFEETNSKIGTVQGGLL